MNYKIGIYGISGVGKTTLIKAISKKIYNSQFFEGSKIIENLINLEDFKKLPSHKKYKYREKVIEFISNRLEKRYIFVDGHYSFIKGNRFEKVITKKDINFYNHIFYIDIKSSLIKRRQLKDKTKKRNFSITDIHKWKKFEKFELRKICKKHNIKFHIINHHNIDKNIEIIYEIINEINFFNEMEEFVKNNTNKKYIVFDADKTLISKDSGKDYIFPLLKLEIEDVIKCFEDGYCFSSFLKLSNLYSKIDKNRFLKVQKDLSLQIEIEDKFLNLIKKYNKNYTICIVTAGFKYLWQEILKKYNIYNVKVIGGNNFLVDNYIIDNRLKGGFVDYLKRNNKYVISFGDSEIDKEMLIKSDKGFLVLRDKKRKSLIEVLKKYKHIRYLSLNGLKIQEMKKVDFEMINKELENEVI